MGGAVSGLAKPSKITSKADLVLQTQEIQKMADALFTFMYGNWEDKEIQDMADNPGEYVIAISDLITSTFHVLGFTTTTNNLEKIYVRKYKDLDPTKTSASNTSATNTTEIQARHAKIIAFFFVRIFQILGALLLVVKDINFPDDSKSDDYSNAKRDFAMQAKLARYQDGGDPDANEANLKPYPVAV
jgi:hypothetical protein